MHRAIAKWGFFVFVMGSLVPGAGCLSGDDDNEGRICASPKEGGTYCVDSSSGPNAAWNEAMAHGSEPIAMWVIWPDKVTLEEVVSDKYLLDAWLDEVRDVLDYVRVTKGSAESYHATMNGRLKDNLKRARQLQNEVIGDKTFNSQQFVADLLISRALDDIVPVRTKLVTEKQSFGEIKAIVDQAKVDGAPFAAQFKTFADDFTTYRATEVAETLTYTQWSHEVSAASIDQLTGVENTIVDIAQKASAKPNGLLVSGMKLTAEILQFDKTLVESIAPHQTVLLDNNARIPDLSSRALRALHAMLGYAEQRVARSDATAKSLLLGSAMRRSALQLLANADAPARTTITTALLAKAETSFAQSAQVQVDAIKNVQMSKLGLPYLEHRYDEHAALLQMIPLCNAKTSSWRETGCVAMRAQFKDAGTYLQKTLPAEIAAGLGILKNKGADTAMIQKVEQKLQSGDIKGAATAYDVLLQSTEGT